MKFFLFGKEEFRIMVFFLNLLIKLDFTTSVGDLRVFNNETFIAFCYFVNVYTSINFYIFIIIYRLLYCFVLLVVLNCSFKSKKINI